MPLDRYVGGTFYDLIGSKHGKGEKGAIYGGIGYKGLTTGVAEIKTTSDQTIDFGYFGNCISDFALCPYGITIGFWFWAKMWSLRLKDCFALALAGFARL